MDLVTAQAEITALYQNLGLNPDPNGVAQWAAQLMDGTPLSTITTIFAESLEVQNALTTAYQAIYGQPLTTVQLAAAESELASGQTLQAVETPWVAQALQAITDANQAIHGQPLTTAQLAAAESGLASGQTLQAVEAPWKITSLYDTLFNSRSEPTSWLQMWEGGTSSNQVLTDLASTHQAETLISTLCQQTTGQLPTPAQIDVAQGLLASGASTQAITASFIPSPVNDVTAVTAWISPIEPANLVRGSTGSLDVMNLFVPGNSWSAVAPGQSGFGMDNAEAGFGTQSQLEEIFSYLQQNDIPLTIGAEMLNGANVEGCNGGPAYETAVAARDKEFGGNLEYVAMDEPLYYGSEYTGPGALELSIAENAKEVAETADAIKVVFPNVQFVDTEPLPGTSNIMQFAQDFLEDAGQPLAYVAVDMQWGNPNWKAALESLAESLTAAGIGLQIDYHDDSATTAAGWVQMEIESIAAVETDPILQSSVGVICTWTEYPTNVLPDNNPCTLTYVELVYDNIAPLWRNGTLSPLPNDAPVISAPTEISAVLGSATPLPGITVCLDGSTPTNAKVAVMLTDTTGLLYVTDSAQATGNGTTSVTLSGNTAQVNAALNTLSYVGRMPGPDSVQITSFDGGGAPGQQAIPLQVGEALSQIPVSALQPSPSMTFVSGNDTDTVLQGTGTPDVFDLTGDNGALTQILMFDPRQDIIELPSSMIPDFTTLTHDITATAGGAFISLDATHSILVIGTAPESLQAANFTFG